MRYPTTPNAGVGRQSSLADIGAALAPVAHPVRPSTRVTVSARRERALARQALRENLKKTLIRDDAKRVRSLMPDRGGEVKKLH